MGVKVKLKDVRVAYAKDLFTKSQYQGQGAFSYSGTFIFEKGGEVHKKVAAKIVEAAEMKWPGEGKAMAKKLIASNRVCLHDGEEKDGQDGFEGMMYVSARQYDRLRILDQNKVPITVEEGKLFSGCYVDAILDISAQDNKFGKRLNAYVTGVQLRREGPSMAGTSVATDDDFEDIDNTGDAEEKGEDDLLGFE